MWPAAISSSIIPEVHCKSLSMCFRKSWARMERPFLMTRLISHIWRKMLASISQLSLRLGVHRFLTKQIGERRRYSGISYLLARRPKVSIDTMKALKSTKKVHRKVWSTAGSHKFVFAIAPIHSPGTLDHGLGKGDFIPHAKQPAIVTAKLITPLSEWSHF